VFNSLYEITPPEQMKNVCQILRPYYSGILIANDSFDAESGITKIRSGDADMISYGRFAISNPDLTDRLVNNWQLSEWDHSTFYNNKAGAKGYTDYPFYSSK
jgi:N-ethylmaleimide reductase